MMAMLARVEISLFKNQNSSENEFVIQRATTQGNYFVVDGLFKKTFGCPCTQQPKHLLLYFLH
jgi:hypothetical protein